MFIPYNDIDHLSSSSQLLEVLRLSLGTCASALGFSESSFMSTFVIKISVEPCVIRVPVQCFGTFYLKFSYNYRFMH